jgi:D-alanyl-D-alanine dipeptidase
MTRVIVMAIFLVFVSSSAWADSLKEIDHLVRISDIDSAIIIDLRYATSDNFTKKEIYPAAVGVLRLETAQRLAAANAEFQKQGYRLKIWDAYRPPYVQKIFWSMVPDDRYVANPYKGGSRHNRGGAVDVTLVDRSGLEIEMPSGFDDFSSSAWPNNFSLKTQVRKNVNYLRKVMMSHGFMPIEHEWWHFDDRHWKTFPLVDVLLEKFIVPPDILKSLGSSRQAILVTPANNTVFQAKVTAWENKDQQWQMAFPLVNAVVGRNGIAELNQKKEGDGKTPSGVFFLKTAFGYKASIDSKMEYKQATSEDVWVDDVNSKNYNHWEKMKDIQDAQSFEQMKRDDDLYKAGVVIEYNTQPVTPGLGSAIFLHIWRNSDRPTAGCVAVSQENIFKLLKWLDPSYNPVIVIQK